MGYYRQKTYQVVTARAVTVDYPDGNVYSYPSGHMFLAQPTNKSVIRLLRQNSIREVTARELPKKKA